MDEPSPQSIRDLFARHQLRCTRQREDIYAALAASKSHPTAEELYSDVRRTQADLSLATVYNTLEAFTRSGLCRRMAASGAGASRYDGDLSAHLHLVTADGRVLDIPEELGQEVLSRLPEELLARVSTAMGMQIDRSSISFLAAPTQ
jgi:Fur family ferric uptake transcriptional regulator